MTAYEELADVIRQLRAERDEITDELVEAVQEKERLQSQSDRRLDEAHRLYIELYAEKRRAEKAERERDEWEGNAEDAERRCEDAEHKRDAWERNAEAEADYADRKIRERDALQARIDTVIELCNVWEAGYISHVRASTVRQAAGEEVREPADDGSEEWKREGTQSVTINRDDLMCVPVDPAAEYKRPRNLKETADPVHSDAENESSPYMVGDDSEATAHFTITEDGTVYQNVPITYPPFKPGDWVRHYYAEECVGEVGGVEPRDGTVGVGWIGANKLQWHHQNHLEPWQPRKYERVTGESCHGRSTYTGEYDPDYRAHIPVEGCVPLNTRPSVYSWVRWDSLRPAKSGGEQ